MLLAVDPVAGQTPSVNCASPPAVGTPMAGYNVIVATSGTITVGTEGDDLIYGTPGPDRIAGLGGNDVIIGFGGDDQLSGGDGNDTLCGGDGNDSLAAGAGNDLLSGDNGNDDLSGGVGNDRLIGGLGVDRLVGGDGWDTCLPGGQPGDAAAPAPSCDVIQSPATATIVTSATSTPLGSSIHDTATVTGQPAPAPPPTGTVTFTVFDNASCTGPPVFTSADRPLSGEPPTATSASFTPTVGGFYYWVASYSGDSNYSSVSGACGDVDETSAVWADGTLDCVTPTTDRRSPDDDAADDSDTQFDFGGLYAGQTQEVTVTCTASGPAGAPLKLYFFLTGDVYEPHIGDTGGFNLGSGTCVANSLLMTGDSCTVIVTFHATKETVPDFYVATLHAGFHDSGSSAEVVFEGSGLGPRIV